MSMAYSAHVQGRLCLPSDPLLMIPTTETSLHSWILTRRRSDRVRSVTVWNWPTVTPIHKRLCGSCRASDNQRRLSAACDAGWVGWSPTCLTAVASLATSHRRGLRACLQGPESQRWRPAQAGISGLVPECASCAETADPLSPAGSQQLARNGRRPDHAGEGLAHA
jgi:hypothetical protein